VVPGTLDFRGAGAVAKETVELPRPVAQDLSQLAGAFLLRNYAPPTVIVNSRGDILHIHGRTGKYLEPHPGKARMNVLEMAREGLNTLLASALRRAVSRGQKVTETGINVVSNGGTQELDLTVAPLSREGGLLAVILQEVLPRGRQSNAPSRKAPGKAVPGQITKLERELADMRASHQTTVEELETSNEELRSANEELQSTNEELQSTNEELETSKEEMQALHEEVTTVNSELQGKLDELASVNNDLKNLLESTGMPMLFLDANLRIRSITQDSSLVSYLVQADIGRPITDFASKLRYDGLAEDAQRVLKELVRVEREVETTDGRWYLMRIAPYRTLDNVIDGVVITFLDINDLRQVQEGNRRLGEQLSAARDLAEAFVEVVSNPILVLDQGLRVVSANRSFYAYFRAEPAETVGSYVFELGNRQWDVPGLRGLLEAALREGRISERHELENDFPYIGFRRLSASARPLVYREGSPNLILLALQEAGHADEGTV
jgi:two-component system CheB/CheR fusion protein